MGMLPKGLSENDTARRGGLSIVSQRHYFIEDLRIFMARTAPPRTVAAVGQHIIDRRPAGVMPDNPEEFLGECIDRGELKLSSFHFDHDKLGDAIAILAGKTGIRKIWAINQNTGKLDPLLHMIKARIPDFDPIMLRKALTVMEIRWDTLKVALEPPGIACILKNIIDNEDCEDLRMFLASGADPNIRDENNDMAPLHWACWKGDANMVRLLLAAGAYPNVWDCSRYSPLHYACEREDIEIMSLLIEHGADVDAKNDAGNTPLHYACTHGMVDVTRLLLESGADPEAENHLGVTPLDLAINCRPVSDREPLLTVFQQFAPGLYFSAFCTAGPGGGP